MTHITPIKQTRRLAKLGAFYFVQEKKKERKKRNRDFFTVFIRRNNEKNSFRGQTTKAYKK